MGGLEFEAYDSIIKGRASDHCTFNAPLYRKIISRKDYFILPGITRGTGQFPNSSPRVIENGKSFPYEDIKSGKMIPECFQDPHTAFAVLNLSLAIQTKVSLERVDMQNGLPIYTEGGFSNNEAYNILVGGFYPDSDVFLTSLKEATSFGAALMGKAAVEQKHPKEFKDLLKIDKIPVKKYSFEGLDEYTKEFLRLIE